jgi:HAMP domain-containing protein
VRRIPIHIKLSAALVFPLLALLAVAAYEVVESSRDAAELRRQVDLSEAVVGPSGLFNALQDERNRATVDLVDMGHIIPLPVATNADARTRTDVAIADFAHMVDSHGDEVRAAYEPALAELDGLAALRADVDIDRPPDPDVPACEVTDCSRIRADNWSAADEIFTRYTTMVDALLDATSKVAVSIDDPDLRRGADVTFQAARQADSVARVVKHVLVTGIGPGGFDSREEMIELGALHGRATRGEATLHDIAIGPYAAIAAPAHEHAAIFFAQIEHTIATGEVAVEPFLGTLATQPDETYDGPFRDQVKAILEDQASHLRDQADERVRLFRVLAAVAALIAGVATWIVSRSITLPLRSLTRQATRMARHRLPGAVLEVLETPLGDDVVVPQLRPVTVRTRDEVADVATAINTVQSSALDLALEQALLRRNIADSLVNLGRRNQTLVARQLAFITELERGETDPDVLDDLFRLDHLATRMRRHADSLVVLAGGEPARRWSHPVNIVDAVRAALGEVEDYHRVSLRQLEPATIHGGAAADLAHLLAELLENGLTYSPPDELVEIRGRCQLVQRTVPPHAPAPLHHGLAMGYALVVVDHGVGMRPAEVERANRRLAGAESFTIAPSKYLGHYVAGMLAARHGIGVTLYSTAGTDPHGTPAVGMGPGYGNPYGSPFGAGPEAALQPTDCGVTATIGIPPELITTTPPEVADVVPDTAAAPPAPLAEPTRSPV